MIQLESIEHDCVRDLKSQSYNQMSTWNESVGLRARGYERPKFYSETGGNTDFFLFSRSKLSDGNIGIIGDFI